MKGDVHRRMLVWFVANPGETLLMADIALKFGCSTEAARNAAKTLHRERTCIVAEDPSYDNPGGKRRLMVSIGPALTEAIETGRT